MCFLRVQDNPFGLDQLIIQMANLRIRLKLDNPNDKVMLIEKDYLLAITG